MGTLHIILGILEWIYIHAQERYSTRQNPFTKAPSTMFLQSFQTIILLMLAFVGVIPAEAKIVGFSAPTTVIKPGHDFKVTFRTTDWIINNEQYYAIFGITIGTSDSQGMGLVLGDGYGIAQHGHKSTGVGAFDVTLQIPAGFKPPARNTKYVLRTAVLGTVSKYYKHLVKTLAAECHLRPQAGITEGATLDFLTANITVA